MKLIVSNRGLEFAIDRDNVKEIGEAIFRNLDSLEDRMSEMPHLHGCKSAAEELPTTETPRSYTKICRMEQVRHGKSFVMEGQTHRNNSRSPWMGGVLACHGGHNASLVNALKQAWEWNDWIEEEKIGSIEELVKKVQVSRRYAERILNMRHLSPKIQLMILKGTQPLNWTTRTFIRAVPPDWKEQEEIFHA